MDDMDRKREIKNDILVILKEVYKIPADVDTTDRQQEFVDKVLDYLDANISLRRKVKKDKVDPNALEGDNF